MPTIIQKTWFELDKYIETAFDWPGEGKNPEPTPGSVDEWCDYLEDRVDYVGKTAIGRGLAIAILIASAPFYETADQVVAHAVKRYEAKKAGQEMPETVGFMNVAAEPPATQQPVQQENSATPAGRSRQIGLDDEEKPKKKSAPAKTPVPGLTEEQVGFIKSTAATGFTALQIAQTIGIDVSVVEGVLA